MSVPVSQTSPVEVISVSAKHTCALTGKVTDLGLLTYYDKNHPIKSWFINRLITVKIKYFNATRRRLFPKYIP
jgi:hypothetical protein